MQTVIAKAVSELVTLALNELPEMSVVTCLKDTSDEMLKAFEEWRYASDLEGNELLPAFQDGAFGDERPEENADDPAVQASFKAGRIWRISKEAEVHRELDLRAIAMLELLKK